MQIASPHAEAIFEGTFDFSVGPIPTVQYAQQSNIVQNIIKDQDDAG